jgi:hypothetical protein
MRGLIATGLKRKYTSMKLFLYVEVTPQSIVSQERRFPKTFLLIGYEKLVLSGLRQRRGLYE